MFLHVYSSLCFCYGFSMFNCFPFSWNQFRPRQGFRAQAAKWPRNPLDDVISSFAFDFFLRRILWVRNFLCILRLVEEGGIWWHSILVLPVAIELIRMVLMLNWNFMEVPEHHVIGDFGCGDARLALELKNRQACAEGFSTLKLWGKTNHKPWRSTPLILFRSIAGATFWNIKPNQECTSLILTGKITMIFCHFAILLLPGWRPATWPRCHCPRHLWMSPSSA